MTQKTASHQKLLWIPRKRTSVLIVLQGIHNTAHTIIRKKVFMFLMIHFPRSAWSVHLYGIDSETEIMLVALSSVK